MSDTSTAATGASLLDQVCAIYDQFLVLPSKAWRDALAAYVLATHIRDTEQWVAFDYTPRWAFISEGPACGKSLALELTATMCFNGEMLTDPSAYGMLDAITENYATPCVDEIDTWWGRGSGSRTTKSILLDGYKPGKTLRRARSKLHFNSFVVLSGMGANFMTNPDLRALRTRTLICPMKPRPEGVHREKYRARAHERDLRDLARSMTEWGRIVAREVSAAWPEIPDGVSDRTEEVWTSLLAIGEACGPEWANRIRAACRAIETADEPELRVVTPLDNLLDDLATVWVDAGMPEEMTTLSILDGLRDQPRKWGANQSDRAAAMKLSAMLGTLSDDEGNTVGPRKEWRDGRAVQVYKLVELDKHFATSVEWWNNREEIDGMPSDAWDDDVALG